MAEEVKPEVIKKTQDSLKKFIKKPPLTDKLLKKPPFRFLHDIVTNVIKETGFLNDLFSSEELNHENIKDREGKVAFLDKLISAVKIITGIPLSVRATKIVAGHEPTKTNELLQAMGMALDKKLDSKDVAQQLRKKGSKKLESNEASKKLSPRDNKSESSKSKATKLPEEGKELHEESVEKRKRPSPSSKSSKDGDNAKAHKSKSRKDGSRVESKATKRRESIHLDSVPKGTEATPEKIEDQPLIEEPEPVKRPQSAVGQRRSSVVRDMPEVSSIKPKDIEHSSPTKSTPLKTTSLAQSEEPAKGTNNEHGSRPTVHEPTSTSQGIKESKLQPSRPSSSAAPAPVPLARPRTAARVGSARPGAPRVRNRGDAVIVSEEIVKPPPVNLIVDGDGNKGDPEEEDENIVVVETNLPDESTLIPESRQIPQSSTSRPSSQQGHLVSQILETQKELEVGSSVIDNHDGFSHHTEIEWEAGKKREREVAEREMDRMRALVQALTRAAHPLGKLLDSLQEDVDNMHRELLQWQSMQSSLEQQLKMEETHSAQASQPLKEQLRQLQQAIRSQLDQISVSKATILSNDERIRHLLTGGQG